MKQGGSMSEIQKVDLLVTPARKKMIKKLGLKRVKQFEERIMADQKIEFVISDKPKRAAAYPIVYSPESAAYADGYSISYMTGVSNVEPDASKLFFQILALPSNTINPWMYIHDDRFAVVKAILDLDVAPLVRWKSSSMEVARIYGHHSWTS